MENYEKVKDRETHTIYDEWLVSPDELSAFVSLRSEIVSYWY